MDEGHQWIWLSFYKKNNNTKVINYSSPIQWMHFRLYLTLRQFKAAWPSLPVLINPDLIILRNDFTTLAIHRHSVSFLNQTVQYLPLWTTYVVCRQWKRTVKKNKQPFMIGRGTVMYRSYLDGQRNDRFFLNKQYTFHLSFTELFENVITIKNYWGRKEARRYLIYLSTVYPIIFAKI